MASTDGPQATAGRRKSPVLLFVVVILIVVAVVASATVILRHRPEPQQGTVIEGEGIVPVLPPAAEGAKSDKGTPATAGGNGGKASKGDPLPALVPGSKLNDDRFAQISAEVVIAAMGLKQDKEWELNVAAYMQKVLTKQGIGIDDYTAYAKALYDKPDRARAVAENIQLRVEKKLGYRVSMDKLPMFKFDQNTLKKMQRKLEN